MYGRLHEAIPVVVFTCVTLLSLTCQGCASDNRLTEPPSMSGMISGILPSEYADPELRQVQHAMYKGSRLAVVCASPRHPVASTNTPPYARFFLVSLGPGDPLVLGWIECTGDVICEQVSAEVERGGVVASVVSRPYSGSVTRYHLRVYRYGGNGGLSQQLVVKYVDGVMAVLPSRTGEAPAFLIAEPLYEKSKFGPQRYQFRLYTSVSRASYGLKSTLLSKRAFKDERHAYRAIRPKVVADVGASYSVPKALQSPTTTP